MITAKKSSTTTILCFLIGLAYLTSNASAINLFVEIEPIIKGTTYFVNYSTIINHTPQKIWTYWEDKGSVGCTNQLRIDIYDGTMKELHKTPEETIDSLDKENQNRLIYTAWSKPTPFHPGANNNLITYWYPYNFSANVTAQFRMYSCNEIYKKPPFTFEVLNWTRFPDTNKTQKLFDKINIINKDETHIEITLTSSEDITNLLILPEKYPRGWIFEYAKITELKKGKETKVNIPYTAGIWRPATVTLAFVTEDGTHYLKKDYLIDKVPVTDWLSIFSAISIILLITTFFFIAYRRHRSKTLPDKDTVCNKKPQTHKKIPKTSKN